jgi:Flp pilus assembly protein CpaB
MAALAWFLVVNTTRSAREAAAATAAKAETLGVRQVYAVMATKDIPQFTPIRADAVAVKAFPAAYAPPGLVASVDDVVGKYTTTAIVRDQLVLNTQVSPTRRSVNLSASIPAGKVA